MIESASGWVLFLGRLHPVLVHLPIGFLVLLAALEVMALIPRWRQLNGCSGAILVLLVPASAASAGCGWLLSSGGGYDVNLLASHRWTGTATAIATAILLALHWRGKRAAYRVGLFLVVGLMTVASHFGGSLTHGRDYLTRHAPEPFRSLLGRRSLGATGISAGGDLTRQPVFAAAVQPLLTKYCVSCHGPDKAKGKLRLDTLEALLTGGDSGPSIVPGKAAGSLLTQRLGLPLDHDDHMPPEGKPQLTDDEIALLKWWIDAGAAADPSARALQAPEHILQLLSAPRPTQP